MFHLTTASQWRDGEAAGAYRAPSLAEIGFIHCSNAEQVARVARERFADTPELVVLTIDVDLLGTSELVDEPGDPGSDEPFPHVYGPIPAGAVRAVDPYELR